MYGYQRGKGMRGMNQEFGINRYPVQGTISIILQSLRIEKNVKKKYTHTHRNHSAVHLELTQHCKPAILQFKQKEGKKADYQTIVIKMACDWHTDRYRIQVNGKEQKWEEAQKHIWKFSL